MTLLTHGVGSLAISSGSIDVLGYVDGKPVADPFKAIADLPEDHPYRLVGENDVRASLDWLKALCAKKDQEILRLSRVLGLETPRQPMKDGCEAALNLVKSQEKGKVNSVNEKFGFVVVSLGRNTRVQEQFGNRVNNVDPQIVNGAILTVARNMPSGEAEYINKVKIVRLDADCSIAEPIDKKGGREIEAGDMVYFADDEIARLVKNRK